MQPLLNHAAIADQLINQERFAEGHGVIKEAGFLGTSLLYFTLAYMLPAKTAVVLGSGSGFVPRLIRQAQREVHDADFLQSSRCILIDADRDINNFGWADYHEAPSHFFRLSYPDVEIWKMTTDEACMKLQDKKGMIDYLHIDADHTHEQSLKDFENYLPLMASDFVITLHDTATDHLELAHDGCVPRTIAYLRRQMESGGKYEHLEMINFNNRYRRTSNHFQGKLRCRGTAVVKPKTLSIWDTELGEALWVNGNISAQSPSKSGI